LALRVPDLPGSPRASLKLPRWTDRAADARSRPPADLVHDITGRVPPLNLLLFALQHLSIQLVYLLLPLALAQALSLDTAETVGLLSLTLLCMAGTAILHTLPRGPVGSGYALSCIPAPVALGAYLVAAEAGIGPAGAGPAILAAAALGLVVVLLLPGLLRRLPIEVAGVVSFTLGVSLLPLAADLGFGPAAERNAVPLLFGVLAVVVAGSVARWPLSPFALLIGAALGTGVALAVTPPDERALAGVAAQPLLALPRPAVPELGAFDPALVPAFLVAAIGMLPGVLGNALALQRTGNADWMKPDPAPLQRSFVAVMLGMGLSGGLGGMAATTSAGGVGLSIATRVLARSVVWANAAILVALACSPWLLAQILLLPGPVSAALLLYIACVMIASGTGQIASRVLDRRRTCTVGLGLCAAFLALLAPEGLEAILPPALGGPVTLGFLVAAAVHFLTLPLVRQRQRATVALGAAGHRGIERFVSEAAGAFGLRRTTADAALHAALEIAEVLAARGVREVEIEMREADTRLALLLRHAGPPLPRPARSPSAGDLAAGVEAGEAFAMWLAARTAESCAIRREGAGAAVELVFSE
jgi:xanthine/uracil permease